MQDMTARPEWAAVAERPVERGETVTVVACRGIVLVVR